MLWQTHTSGCEARSEVIANLVAVVTAVEHKSVGHIHTYRSVEKHGEVAKVMDKKFNFVRLD